MAPTNPVKKEIRDSVRSDKRTSIDTCRLLFGYHNIGLFLRKRIEKLVVATKTQSRTDYFRLLLSRRYFVDRRNIFALCETLEKIRNH